MSTRTTKREIYALVQQLGAVMGYRPAPVELRSEIGLGDGPIYRPTCETDGMAHGDERVHGYILSADHASCYGGWALHEVELVTNHMGRIVPSGHSPVYETRMGAGEFASALRLARNTHERVARVREAREADEA